MLRSLGQPLKALVMSPLFNLPPSPVGGPTIVHHVTLRGGGDVIAVARLSLAPDGCTLTVKVSDRDGKWTVDAQLRRVGGLLEAQGRDGDSNLQLLELTRLGGFSGSPPFQQEIILDGAGLKPLLCAADHPPLPISAVEGLRADSALGLPMGAAPSKAAPAPEAEQSVQYRQGLSYFQRRLSDELAAAECADVAVASSRHVEMATLYVRTIRALRAAAPY